MTEEKEIKVRILDAIGIDEIKSAIESEFNVKFADGHKDEDAYHDLKNYFYFRMNQGLRIRNDEEIAYKALFFIPEKEPNHWFVYEKEHKLPISKQDLIGLFDFANIRYDPGMPSSIDIDELKAILKGLGFTEKIKIRKTRWSATNKDYKICVDSVERLGSFVEIEVKDDDFLETFRKRLPFRYEEIRHGYTELYAKEVLKIKAPDFKEKFLSDPDWNYLDGQKQIIRQNTQEWKKRLKAYLAIKYHEDLKNRELIESISRSLREAGFKDTISIRDHEKWGATRLTPKELMETAFRDIADSDILLVDFSEKGVGLGIEIGYAYAKGIPIVVIAKTGSEISSTLHGIARETVFYDLPEELTKKLKKLKM